MSNESDPLAVERRFFRSLVAADTAALDEILTDDFILIAVVGGAEVTKPALIGAVGSGQAKFETIEPVDARVRVYGTTAVITGRTRMSGRLGETAFTADSRYTHVFVEQHGQWRLASAQGTQILDE